MHHDRVTNIKRGMLLCALCHLPLHHGKADWQGVCRFCYEYTANHFRFQRKGITFGWPLAHCWVGVQEFLGTTLQLKWLQFLTQDLIADMLEIQQDWTGHRAIKSWQQGYRRAHQPGYLWHQGGVWLQSQILQILWASRRSGPRGHKCFLTT